MRKHKDHLILVAVALGVLLRFADIAVPDLATDEAQFALGNSAAQPPVGIAFMRLSQGLFGANVYAVRLVSILFGLATLPLVYMIAKEVTNEKTAQLALAIAALFPSHIYYSRLGYLSVPLFFSWALLLYAFLKTRSAGSDTRAKWTIAVFVSGIFCTMIKTQGLLLPVFLALGLVLQKKKKVFHDDLFWALIFSLIPIGFYILANPGIGATLALYGGNQYGLSNIFHRAELLMSSWIHMLGIFLIAAPLVYKSWRQLSWPLYTLIGIGAGIGFVLGPGHTYYTTHLLLLSIPIAIGIAKLSPMRQHLCVGLLLVWTLLFLAPSSMSPLTYEHFAEHGEWNVHSGTFNELLQGEESVTVLGSAGHHIRWYLGPRALVGKDMEDPYSTKYALPLSLPDAAGVQGTIEYVARDAGLMLLK